MLVAFLVLLNGSLVEGRQLGDRRFGEEYVRCEALHAEGASLLRMALPRQELPDVHQEPVALVLRLG